MHELGLKEGLGGESGGVRCKENKQTYLLLSHLVVHPLLHHALQQRRGHSTPCAACACDQKTFRFQVLVALALVPQGRENAAESDRA